MTAYEYYLQNKENISTVNIKQLKVDKELNQWDYQYVYDIMTFVLIFTVLVIITCTYL